MREIISDRQALVQRCSCRMEMQRNRSPSSGTRATNQNGGQAHRTPSPPIATALAGRHQQANDSFDSVEQMKRELAQAQQEKVRCGACGWTGALKDLADEAAAPSLPNQAMPRIKKMVCPVCHEESLFLDSRPLKPPSPPPPPPPPVPNSIDNGGYKTEYSPPPSKCAQWCHARCQLM